MTIISDLPFGMLRGTQPPARVERRAPRQFGHGRFPGYFEVVWGDGYVEGERSCGHEHRSRLLAELCQERLMGIKR